MKTKAYQFLNSENPVVMEGMTLQEMRFIRREIINEFLHLGYKTVGNLRKCVRYTEVERHGFMMMRFTQWDGWDFGGGIDDPRY